MKVLVTGANGYIGQGVLKELLKMNVEIIAADVIFEQRLPNIHYVTKSIFDEEDPFDAFGRPDVLLHLAWRDGFRHFSDSHIEDIPKHFFFLRKMIDSGVKQVCCMGSMHEIGFYEGCIDENTPTKPISYYGIGKNSLRQILELLVSEKSVVFQWIRGFYIVGNTERGCSIFSRITEAEKRGDSSFPFTSGTNQYDFIEYELFCKEVVAVIMQKEVTGIINCCSGIPERLGNRVEKFLKDNNYQIKLAYGTFPDRPYDSKAVWGSTSKIERIMDRYDDGSVS